MHELPRGSSWWEPTSPPPKALGGFEGVGTALQGYAEHSAWFSPGYVCPIGPPDPVRSFMSMGGSAVTTEQHGGPTTTAIDGSGMRVRMQ